MWRNNLWMLARSMAVAILLLNARPELAVLVKLAPLMMLALLIARAAMGLIERRTGDE